MVLFQTSPPSLPHDPKKRTNHVRQARNGAGVRQRDHDGRHRQLQLLRLFAFVVAGEKVVQLASVALGRSLAHELQLWRGFSHPVPQRRVRREERVNDGSKPQACVRAPGDDLLGLRRRGREEVRGGKRAHERVSA